MPAVWQEVCLGCWVLLTLVAHRPAAGQLHWWRWEGMLVAFPIVSYGFTAHQYLFQVGARHSLARRGSSCGAASFRLLVDVGAHMVNHLACRRPLSSQIYPSSQKPSLKRMTTAMQRGMVLSAVVYVAVGASGYSAYGSR